MKMTKSAKIGLLTTTAIIGSLTTAAIVHTTTRDFRPVLMNFEAYMSPDAIAEIQKNFQYKVFKELNEFSRAVESNRVVGGIASDFEIARLAIGNKISKVKYEKILRDIEELKDENKATAFEANKMLKKSIVAKYIRQETMNHMDSYNEYLVDYQGKRIDIDKDGVADEMWEFMIPYYIQDKVMAYPAGVYETGAIDPVTQEKITAPLRPASYNSFTDEEKEKGIRFDSQSFVDISKKLVEKNLTKFTWTEASRDNLLIGSELKNDDIQKEGDMYSGYVTPKNYRSMIDGFLEVVKQGTGATVHDVTRNRFLSSGSEILQSLINPNSIGEVGVMYNGDALDALYSRDNFSSVPDGQIKYIRPKNNITLLEGWILNKNNDAELNDKIYDTLYAAIYQGVDKTQEELFHEIATWNQMPFFVKNAEGNQIVETTKIKKTINGIETEIEEIVWEKEGKKNYGLTLDYSLVPILRNFDFINYTPSWKGDFEMFKKMYFNDATSYIKLIPDSDEETMFLHKDGEIISYQIDGNVKMLPEDEEYNPEKSEHQNTLNHLFAQKLENYTFGNISYELSDSFTKTLLNIFITQQKQQTVYGGMVEENTPKEDIYTIEYESIKPISDKLRSELISYYNLKTKR